MRNEHADPIFRDILNAATPNVPDDPPAPDETTPAEPEQLVLEPCPLGPAPGEEVTNAAQ